MNALTIASDRAYYPPGQIVQLCVSASQRSGGRVTASISHLSKEVATLAGELDENGESWLSWVAPDASPRGYGVDVRLHSSTGTRHASTAFEVLDHWYQRPNYGFVTDFSPGRQCRGVLDALSRFHINSLQFYDWQYRHDQLVAPVPDYQDPLGRSISLDTVRNFVKEAGQRGMAAMAYCAVYAASLDFQRAHLDWALFDRNATPLAFEGFLGYMDPTPGRPWSNHLLSQCEGALDLVGFDGIHLDQYGEPRECYDVNGARVDLSAAFSGFVSALKDRRPHAVVTLNAVRNWPAEALAKSAQDFYYVEIWPDLPTYDDLGHVVLEARRNSQGKPVVVAVYIPADRPDNVLLADAHILARGGTRIEVGENARLLTDPYFPNHQPIPPELGSRLRNYRRLAARYGDLLFTFDPSAASQVTVDPTPGVSAVVHRSPGWLAVSLLNMQGVEGARWDLPHASPIQQENVEIHLTTRHRITKAFVVNADSPDDGAHEVVWKPTEDGGIARIPTLDIWSLLLLETPGSS